MRYLLYICFTGILFSTGVFCQDIHIGFSGTFTLTIDEQNEAESFEHRNVGVMGLDFNYLFLENLPITLGGKLRYGTRKLVDNGPVFEEGSSSPFGSKRDLKFLLLEFPATYRIPLSRSWTLTSGLQIGFAYVRLNEAGSFYESLNTPIGRATGSGSGTALSLVPVAELVHEMDIPVFLTLGAGYRFLQFDIDWQQDFPNSNLNNLISSGRSTFNLDGLYFNIGAHLRLFGVDEDY